MQRALKGGTHTPANTDNVLRTFRLKKTTVVDLAQFLDDHPEVGTMNHLVEVALREFVAIHRDDRSWLRTER